MTCIVCRHPERDAIETSLIAGDALRDIERRFGVSDDALGRHRKVDIPELMAQSKQALAEVRGDTLYDRLRMLNSETQQILQEAKQSKNPELALRAINRIERQLELEAKLLGQLDESAKIAIGINNAPQQQQNKLDLSALTDDEFDELQRLYRKMGAVAQV
ncbi:MAG: hypothetical protein ACR2IV_20470 [Bryobacteraceae bacterium]